MRQAELVAPDTPHACTKRDSPSRRVSWPSLSITNTPARLFPALPALLDVTFFFMLHLDFFGVKFLSNPSFSKREGRCGQLSRMNFLDTAWTDDRGLSVA